MTTYKTTTAHRVFANEMNWTGAWPSSKINGSCFYSTE